MQFASVADGKVCRLAETGNIGRGAVLGGSDWIRVGGLHLAVSAEMSGKELVLMGAGARGNKGLDWRRGSGIVTSEAVGMTRQVRGSEPRRRGIGIAHLHLCIYFPTSLTACHHRTKRPKSENSLNCFIPPTVPPPGLQIEEELKPHPRGSVTSPRRRGTAIIAFGGECRRGQPGHTRDASSRSLPSFRQPAPASRASAWTRKPR